MKRYAVLSALLLALCLSSTAGAADARDYAARQQAAEEQRRVSARLQALEEALEAYQKEVTSLRNEIRSLRQDLGRSTAGASDTKVLADKIKEVDEKRMADNKQVLDALKQLQKSAAATRRPDPAPSKEEYEYEIRAGDTLFDIVKGLNTEGFNVTVPQIQQANPTVKWTQLRIGQKIVIPAPKR